MLTKMSWLPVPSRARIAALEAIEEIEVIAGFFQRVLIEQAVPETIASEVEQFRCRF